MTSDTATGRRSGPETRAAILQTALRLFTTNGYEATSMREIAEILGIKKASLYYHFSGKEEIVRSLFQQRSSEAERLLDWVTAQEPSAGLVRTAVMRWVESFSADKLLGIRFLSANPRLPRAVSGPGGEQIGSALVRLADALTRMLPDPSPTAALHLRMALLSINAAVEAAAGGDFTDEQILAAARRNAEILAGTLVPGREDESGGRRGGR